MNKDSIVFLGAALKIQLITYSWRLEFNKDIMAASWPLKVHLARLSKRDEYVAIALDFSPTLQFEPQLAAPKYVDSQIQHPSTLGLLLKRINPRTRVRVFLAF